MRRLVLAACLAVMAGAAQAQSADERAPRPGHANPSLVEAVRKWWAEKTAPAAAPAKPQTRAVEAPREPRRHARHHHPKPPETPAPNVVAAPAAPAAPAAAPITTASAPVVPAAPTDAAAPAPAILMPRRVATITVVPPRRAEEAPRRHGRSECTTGERIITAFYWEGSHTASGARFDPDGMTAAHRTFAFGTKLLVINPRNGRSVTVTVNDRGPFTRGVTLDLSRGAAKAIGLQGNAAVCMAKI
jgi:rare lipoprotein A